MIFWGFFLAFASSLCHSVAVNSTAGRWRLTGKYTADRGRGSRDLRAGLAGRVVWLLPKFLWSFSGGEGCESGAHFARRDCDL